ncbi:MAG: hypothetical protein ACRCW2_12670 [Cellulosilyticaceae bacterium]
MNNNLNKMFGERYIKACSWVPWIAIICLVISLKQDEVIKWGITYAAFALLLGNALYIVYKYLKYKMVTKKCG